MGIDRKHRADQHPEEPLHCPACGSLLDVRLISVKGEAADVGELVLMLDCPQGDFHATATHEDVVAALTEAVKKRLGP